MCNKTYSTCIVVVGILLSLFLASLLAAQHAFALMPKIGLPELKKKSDSIVRGEVVSMKSEWNEDGSYIWTFVDIKVSQWIKDRDKEEGLIVVKIPGGTVGDITQSSSDEVTFKNGEEVLLFLRKVDNEEFFNVVGRDQGKFTIKEGKVMGKGVPSDRFIEAVVDE